MLRVYSTVLSVVHYFLSTVSLSVTLSDSHSFLLSHILHLLIMHQRPLIHYYLQHTTLV